MAVEGVALTVMKHKIFTILKHIDLIGFNVLNQDFMVIKLGHPQDYWQIFMSLQYAVMSLK